MSTKKTFLFLSLILLITSICNSAFAGQIIYVDADASGANNGSGWADAYTSLQSALSVAVSGDEIWVAAGTYTPTTGYDRTISFIMKPGVAIYGGFAGTETNRDQRNWVANQTILSGDIGIQDNNSDNSYHVVVGANNSVLDGFTITGGNTNEDVNDFGGGVHNVNSSPTVANCAFIGNSACGGSESYGGGMGDNNSSPTVTNCTFSSNITLFGGGMGNIFNSNPTVTNCTFSGNSAYESGGGMGNHESSNPIVTNCTFTKNSAEGDAGGGMYNETDCSPTVTNCTFSGNSALLYGGGMCNVYSSSTVTNCTFSGNSAYGEYDEYGWYGGHGGGIYNWYSNSTVTDCTFSNNSVYYAGSGIYFNGRGGGMYNGSSSPTVTRCSFRENSAYSYGGGMCNYIQSNPTITDCTFSGNSAYFYGGGMCNYNQSNPTITDCTFSGNSSYSYGGGIYNYNQSGPTITNCTFSGNSAYLNYGGGIYNRSYSNAVVTNCTFCDNLAVRGGGMYNFTYCNPMVTNCTFCGNDANYGGGMCNSSYCNPSVANCIFWGNIATINGPQIHNLTNSYPTVTYSDIQGSYAGTGNISTDPCFVGNGNYRLLPGSPCIDAGDNNSVPPDYADLDKDGDINEPTPLDLDGFQRFIDDVPTSDTGNGMPPIVDMGAYEFVRSDINHDGTVNIADSVVFASQWGQSNCGECGGADLTGDGQVNMADLGKFVEYWLAGTAH